MQQIVENSTSTQTPIPDYQNLTFVNGEQYGTSKTGIKNYAPILADDDALARETWARNCANPDANIDDLIRAGVDHVNKIYAALNSVNALMFKETAFRALIVGRCFLILKPLVKKITPKVGEWMERSFPHISVRNRQRYILIAQTPRADEYTYLGVDRLYLVCAAVKDLAKIEDDPIGTFLSQNNLNNPENDDLDEFKAAIDRICKPASRSRQKKEDEQLDFNTLSTRLVETINYIIEDRGRLEMVDPKILDALSEKLRAIQEMRTAPVEASGN